VRVNEPLDDSELDAFFSSATADFDMSLAPQRHFVAPIAGDYDNPQDGDLEDVRVQASHILRESPDHCQDDSMDYAMEVSGSAASVIADMVVDTVARKNEYVVQTPIEDGLDPRVRQASADSVTKTLSRGESYMQEVRNRIQATQEKAFVSCPGAGDYMSEHSHSTRRGRIASRRRQSRKKMAHTPWSAAAAAVAEPSIVDNPMGEHALKCRVPFRLAILGTVMTSVLLSCIGMFLPLLTFQKKMQETSESCSNTVQYQEATLLLPLEENVTAMRYSTLLEKVRRGIQAFVLAPADRAVDVVWGTMKSNQHYNLLFDGVPPEQRQQLLLRSWVELAQQSHLCPDERKAEDEPWLGLDCPQRAFGVGVSIGLQNDASSGFLMECASAGDFGGCSLARAETWDRDAAGGSASVYRSTFSGVATQSTPEPVTTGIVPSLKRSYDIQDLLRETRTKPGRAWSELHDLQMAGGLVARGMSWTAPISYCGFYSCFGGVVAASINLLALGNETHRIWKVLADELAHGSAEYNTPVVLSPYTSNVFIVSYVTNSTEQYGNLIASSHVHEADAALGSRVKAEDSSQEIVRATSRALLATYASWEAVSELQESHFSFSKEEALMEPPRNKSCTLSMEEGASDKCLRVGTLAVQMDSRTRWVVIAVMPEGAFRAKGTNTKQKVNAEVESLPLNLQSIMHTARAISFITFVGMAVLSLGLGLGLGALVSRPLSSLGVLMKRLGELDFVREGAEYDELFSSKRAVISEVRELQQAFLLLQRGTEAFARFVPETVVRNILHGENRSTTLCLEDREITIMNSDIKDFTTITEELGQREHLFLLTRYLSVMTRVVEAFDGVVAEIQGDGLVALWNTPDDVDDHAAKACSAALAQQLALSILNAEFVNMDLPRLAIRIGLHTGTVRSGNIGSEKKMKFGCLGEPMKVASHLEEICKQYSVSVVCSGDTFAQLPQDDSFKCRKLDCVRVKASGEMTWIYEVMGRQPACAVRCEDSPAGGDEGECRGTPCSNFEDRNDTVAALQADHVREKFVAKEAIRRSTSSLVAPSAPVWRPRRNPLWRRQRSKAQPTTEMSTRDMEALDQDEFARRMADEALDDDEQLRSPSSQHSQPPDAPGEPVQRSDTNASLSKHMSQSLEVTHEQCRHVEQYEEALTAFHAGRYHEALRISQALSKEFDDVATKKLVSRSQTALTDSDTLDQLPPLEGPCEGGEVPATEEPPGDEFRRSVL